jgi:hypothetical protein
MEHLESLIMGYLLGVVLNTMTCYMYNCNDPKKVREDVMSMSPAFRWGLQPIITGVMLLEKIVKGEGK